MPRTRTRARLAPARRTHGNHPGSPVAASGGLPPVQAPSGSPDAAGSPGEAQEGAGLSVEAEGLRYSLDALPTPTRRRSVVTVRLAAGEPCPGLVDRCDLYAFRSRRGLAQLVADAFGREVGQVMGHLALLLDCAERARRGEAPEPPPERLTPERRAQADELLRAPDLLDRAALAMEQAGHVGEEQVKRIAFLVATSRLLAHPLSMLLLAPSGTGKSAVLDAVAALMPPEAVVSVARLTAQALFYSGPDALRHRLVLVDEYEGQAEADHAVRVLQSRGELRLTATIKGRAESFLVRGPVAVMSGTTRTDLDIQNTSRCLEVALDDGAAQTARVHEAQKLAWSGAPRGQETLGRWQDAQRLLHPALVVIPFAARLRFPARTATDRRTSAKVLGLVAAHALLHQFQRERDGEGRLVATPADYAAVHALLQPVVSQQRDGLSPRAARAYAALAQASAPRSRRELAEHAGWNYMTAARALEELLRQELVRAVDREVPRRYRLVGKAPLLGAPPDLTDPADLA